MIVIFLLLICINRTPSPHPKMIWCIVHPTEQNKRTQYNTTQCNAKQSNATQYNTTVQNYGVLIPYKTRNSQQFWWQSIFYYFSNQVSTCMIFTPIFQPKDILRLLFWRLRVVHHTWRNPKLSFRGNIFSQRRRRRFIVWLSLYYKLDDGSWSKMWNFHFIYNSSSTIYLPQRKLIYRCDPTLSSL